MYTVINEKITRDFRELKQWVSAISDHQSDADLSSISRGLFFVYVYGIFEEVVRQVVTTTIIQLNNARPTINQCIYPLYALALSKNYDSLHNVGNENKWQKRWDISNMFSQNTIIDIPIELFPTDGKNLRFRQLSSIATSFGVDAPILPSQAIGGYIEEIVTNRNDIAHGNKLPKEVGRNYTKSDLLLRCDKISEACSYVVETYQKYITEQKYIKQ